MAEQDNVRTVREAYEAFGRGDIAAVLDRLTDDVEWIEPGSKDIPFAGRHRGREAVSRYFSTLAASLEFETFEPREFIAQGDVVVVLGRETSRTRTTGRAMTTEWAMVFRMRNGKVARFQDFQDTEATAAAFRGQEYRSAAA